MESLLNMDLKEGISVQLGIPSNQVDSSLVSIYIMINKGNSNRDKLLKKIDQDNRDTLSELIRTTYSDNKTWYFYKPSSAFKQMATTIKPRAIASVGFVIVLTSIIYILFRYAL